MVDIMVYTTPWSQDDLAYLEENYGDLDEQTIAENLKRTPIAIRRQAQRLGLGRGELPPGPVEALDLDLQLSNWPCSLHQGLEIVTKKILPKIQRRLGNLVEFDDVYDAGYLWMCYNPEYNMSSLEGRLLRLFSDGPMDSSKGNWGGGQRRRDLGASWPPECAPYEEVNPE